jgi:aspartate kinase
MSFDSPAPSPSSSLSPTPPSSVPMTPPNMHQNTIDPAAKWLVQKFGGTSVGKFATKIAGDIVANYIDQHKVAIVCSARSGSTKALGTTNLLLKAATQCLQNSRSRRKRSNTNGGSNTGTATPFNRSIFGSNGYDGSQSPPPPQSRGRSSSSGSAGGVQQGFSLTPLTIPSAGQPQPEFNATVDLIREEHVKAARESIKDPLILEEILAEVDGDCDWLRNFLFAAQFDPMQFHHPPRSP